MEGFLQSCVGRCKELSGGAAKLTVARAPFLVENPKEGPAANLCGAGPKVERPWCHRAFPAPCGKASLSTQGASGSTAPGGCVSADTTEDRGTLQPIAAKVLMRILYAARMALVDLLRAVCHLACFITK